MTAWLTQITLNFRHPQAHQDLTDAVRMHQRVMSLVPDGLGDEPRRQAGLLYRIEQVPGGVHLLVQTAIQPSVGKLPAGYGQVQVRDLGPLLRWLGEGTLVRYRLTANTCLRKSHSKEVVPLRGAEAEKWWIDRAPGHGLDLQSLISRAPGDAVGGGDQRKRVRHAVTQFDGVAAVTDAGALTTAIITGIGRGKSHGCGLLSLAPVVTAA